ncbi:unnamed protein product, partial [Brassica rapa]
LLQKIWNYRLSFNYLDVKNAGFTEISSQKDLFLFCEFDFVSRGQ